VTTFLLDANVLIALSAPKHFHAERAEEWMSGVLRFATCPITEGAAVRFLVREGARTAEIGQVLEGFSRRPGHEFWEDSLPYAEVALGRVIGHRQVTDAYLVALTRKHVGARLATFDQGLVKTYPDLAVLVA
jgi:predicted nucleic acid-binding protein